MNERALATRILAGDLGYHRLKHYIVESTGLSYYLDKDAELFEKIVKRLNTLDVSNCSEYFRLLEDGQAGQMELDELVKDLTIGETYFFRHEEQFDALRRSAIPHILQKNRSRKQIRIWSAGCSTGAEAYSISILLRREFARDLADWEISILGTDINRKFLAQAREGLFEDWALRASTDEIKDSCFFHSGGAWRIRDVYREGVSFQYHNLVKHSYPSLLNNLTAFDLIVCRNVMIYFSQELTRACIERFRNSLVEDGWLMLGHAEANPDFFRSFRTLSAPGALLFQRGGEAQSREIPSSPFLPSPQPPPLSLPILQSPPEAPTEPREPTEIARIREFADRAEWEKAAESCRLLIESDTLNPAGHFYFALVLEQMGLTGEAANALNRSIYLDRNFALAHYHKGLFLLKTRDFAGAIRSLRNVLAILEPMAPSKTFPEADGISAADLSELTRMQLEVLETS